jgi:Uma2 family endonuclease
MMSVKTLTRPTTAVANDPPITGADLWAMGDIGPCELIEGEIVSMSPTKVEHGRIEFRLAQLIGQFVDQHDLGVVMVGEVGVYVERDPDTIRAADVLYISQERLAEATPDDFLDVAPELIVEIVSPSDRYAYIQTKIEAYLAIGCDIVLLVEPVSETVRLYRSPTQVQILQTEDRLTLPEILPGLEIAVSDIFK